MQLNEYWAKTSPWQSVVTHGIVSGRLAQTLFTGYLSAGTRRFLQDALHLDGPGLEAFLGYLVSLHDIGKIEYGFQSKDPAAQRRMDADPDVRRPLTVSAEVRHERTGQTFLRGLWMDLCEDEDAGDLFSAVVGAHHQGKSGSGAKSLRKQQSWYEAQCAFEAYMRNRFLGDTVPVLPVVPDTEQGAVGALVLGLLILADWISSGPAFADAEDWIARPDAEKKIRSAAEEFLKISTLAPDRIRWPDRFCSFWPKIPPDGMRPLQRETERLFSDPVKKYRFVLLEAPMGEGKTETGVYAALQMAAQWEKDGFYLALPTAATSNQMVGRMRDLFAQHGLSDRVRLLHGTAWLEQSAEKPLFCGEEEDAAANWLTPVKRGLLGQFAVGTVDQAMMAATIVKYGALRLLGLSDKVLIIDEIHSYDAYMSNIIERLLQWCAALEVPVVMLSATLPPEKKQALFAPFSSDPLSEGYPLITAIDENGTVYEKVIPETAHKMTAACSLLPYLNDPAKIAAAAADTVRGGGCVCVLMNTVKEAQAVYTELQKIYTGDLLLFHAQYTAARRAELEERCLLRYGKDKTCRPRQSVLVATQVAEQSLDVDFDAMLTAVAPIDLVIQRLGRVHRHADTGRPAALQTPSLQVLIPEEGKSFGSSAYVYPECLLRSSIRILRLHPEIRIPQDIAAMVREGYSPELAPPEDMIEWQKTLIKAQVEAGASDEIRINEPDKLYNALEDTLLFEDGSGFIAAKTRLGEPTVRVALVEEALLLRLQPYIKTTESGLRIAEIRRSDLAKDVMLQSVSLRESRLSAAKSEKRYIQGDKLLSGVWILPVKDGVCRLADGVTLIDDPALGIIIKEGET